MATFWGIAATGHISREFIKAVQLLPSTDHQVIAIAGRSLSKAKEVADEFSIPTAYGSYSELAMDPNVSVVYVSTIHPYHAEVIKLMLEAGKPVLCEKPLCMNVRQTEEVLELAKTKGLFLMEGYWSRCFPVYDKIRETLREGVVGEPIVLNASFGKAILRVPRISDPTLGGGALLDLGGYVVMIADMVFGGKPEKIVASGVLQKTGVDETVGVVLTYPGGKVAVLTCSASCTLSQKAFIQCSKGIIELPENFWCATDIIINGEAKSYPPPGDQKNFMFENSAGLSYEAEHVRQCLLKGVLESPMVSHESTLNIARIVEEALRQLGVTYNV